MRIIVGITGSTGVVYGVRLLEVLRGLGVETHLIMSKWAARCLSMETDHTPEHVRSLATASASDDNMADSASSGTSINDGMIVAPCSMKTLAAISHGYDETLVARAAGVAIKESRRLVLVPREAPLSAIHLENMLRLARLGVVMIPPVTEFYTRPAGIPDMIDHTVGKCLDQFGIAHSLYTRWGEA